ncbi:ATP-dependent helicase HrpB [uncultured Pseudoteredinibacter sp.]|uniref:ATP-dependent helicase HrpB n=1 Tax=uncultured Pseudoteredinibacter sp. TaxID=1641701 RepID=UPI0026016191|nr:ATP-dependent helicase HrpB [uncultured Pseudoteredinibacter sp.]
MSAASNLLANITLPELPIIELLDELAEALDGQQDTLILQAAPGAGKTTVLPLLALAMPSLAQQKIILLEPRRLAAKAAAERMASLLAEPVGKTVGYRVRMESRVSQETRLEVMTEGLFIRRLQQDPELKDVALIIFDELHERHLDGDLALALALQSREIFRDEQPLKMLLMSATLQSEQLQESFPDAPLIASEGRQYSVSVDYFPELSIYGKSRRELCEAISRAIKIALGKHEGSILLFLPGQGEIQSCLQYLEEQYQAGTISDQSILKFVPLYGELALEKQFQAIAPAKNGERKIVLATDIAESSLTIKDVSIVIDGGLKRSSAFDLNTGMNRLLTERSSKANSKQRAGRAGRTKAGFCLRLWSESEQQGLAEHGQAEILRADLSNLCLQSAAWGAESLDELHWLDKPPVANAWQAHDLLHSLQAIEHSSITADSNQQPGLAITAHGEGLAKLPLHPRLAHMISLSREHNVAEEKLAEKLAALLLEKDPLSSQAHSCDIGLRLQWLNDNSQQRASIRKRINASVQQLRKQQLEKPNVVRFEDKATLDVTELLLLAYPDRLAKRIRETDNAEVIYHLSNGRQAILDAADPIAKEHFLVVAQLGGRKGQQYDRIYLAAAADHNSVLSHCSDELRVDHFVDWDKRLGRFIAQERHYFGKLLLDNKPIEKLDPEIKVQALLRYIKQHHGDCLSLNEEARQLSARINIMHKNAPDKMPFAVSWPSILDRIAPVLEPQLTRIDKLSQLEALDIAVALKAIIDWEQQQYLDRHLPSKIKVASGSFKDINYLTGEPELSVKLQEMFGAKQAPTLLNGRLAIKLQLLSPAGRALALTNDLESFWENAYQDVKKEMRGRYPKHPWPDNPMEAIATAKTKASLAREKKN